MCKKMSRPLDSYEFGRAKYAPGEEEEEDEAIAPLYGGIYDGGGAGWVVGVWCTHYRRRETASWLRWRLAYRFSRTAQRDSIGCIASSLARSPPPPETTRGWADRETTPQSRDSCAERVADASRGAVL